MNCMVFVLSNTETGKVVGIFLHDAASGRVLLKVRPSDQSLMQTFGLWQNKPIIEQVRQEVRGRKLTRRTRVIPTDLAYGRLLLDRFAKLPYQVKFSFSMSSSNLDSTLDSMYQQFADVKPPVATPAYNNPFKSRF